MTSIITSKAPNLPYATVTYTPRYQDQLNNILRLYFNTVDNAIAEIIRTLNYTGPFDTIYANTVEATTVNADFINSDYIDTLNLESVFATLQQLQANTIATASLQGGNGVFNNLTGSNVNASVFTGAGYQINYPYVGATKSADDYATGDNTATIVEFDTADEIRGFTLASNTITADYSGVYKLDYSLQFVNTDNAAHDVVVWLKVNTSDYAKSATKFSIPARKSVGNPSYVCAYSTIMFQIDAGDDIELYWATAKAYSTTGPVDGVYIEYIAAQTVPYAHPAIPASILTLTYVSAPVPAKTQITPIGVAGYGDIGVIHASIS